MQLGYDRGFLCVSINTSNKYRLRIRFLELFLLGLDKSTPYGESRLIGMFLSKKIVFLSKFIYE